MSIFLITRKQKIGIIIVFVLIIVMIGVVMLNIVLKSKRNDVQILKQSLPNLKGFGYKKAAFKGEGEMRSYSGEMKSFISPVLGAEVKIPKEFVIDDAALFHNVPVTTFQAPDAGSFIQVIRYKKGELFRGLTHQEYFEKKKKEAQTVDTWIDGSPIEVNNMPGFFITYGYKKFNIFVTDITVEDGDHVFMIKQKEFGRQDINKTILEGVIHSFKISKK